jgi:hypothetical protein
MLLCYELRTKIFSIQIDEATDCNGTGHLIAYMQYVKVTTINEDMLFCKRIKKKKKLLKIIDNFVK